MHPISHDQVLVRRLLKAVFKVVRCFSCKGRQMLQLQGTPRCFNCKGRQDASAARDATGGAASLSLQWGPGTRASFPYCQGDLPVPSPPSNILLPSNPPPLPAPAFMQVWVILIEFESHSSVIKNNEPENRIV